jgi:hypothetical protein
MKREVDYDKYLHEDDDDEDSAYVQPSSKRRCIPEDGHKSRIPNEAKSVFAALDGGDPNASLAVLQILLEKLKIIPAYYQDAKILLDMQELIMHLHGCSKDSAKKRISRWDQGDIQGDIQGDLNVTLDIKMISWKKSRSQAVAAIRKSPWNFAMSWNTS